MAILRIAACFALLAGCYTVPSDRCALKCTSECPTNTTCGADGFCHSAGDDASCTPTDAGTSSCSNNLMPEGGAEIWTGSGGAPSAIAGHASTSGVEICTDGSFTSLSTHVLGPPVEADASYTLLAWVRTPADFDAGLIAISRFQEFDGGGQAINGSTSPDTPLGDAWAQVATSYTTAGAKNLSAVFVLKTTPPGACLQVSDMCMQRMP